MLEGMPLYITEEYQERRIGLVIAARPRSEADEEANVGSLDLIAELVAGGILNCRMKRKALSSNRNFFQKEKSASPS